MTRYTYIMKESCLAVSFSTLLKAAIPCHYGSFPVLEPTADRFVAALDGKGTQVIVPNKTVGVRI